MQCSGSSTPNMNEYHTDINISSTFHRGHVCVCVLDWIEAEAAAAAYSRYGGVNIYDCH